MNRLQIETVVNGRTLTSGLWNGDDWSCGNLLWWYQGWAWVWYKSDTHGSGVLWWYWGGGWGWRWTVLYFAAVVCLAWYHEAARLNREGWAPVKAHQNQKPLLAKNVFDGPSLKHIWINFKIRMLNVDDIVTSRYTCSGLWLDRYIRSCSHIHLAKSVHWCIVVPCRHRMLQWIRLCTVIQYLYLESIPELSLFCNVFSPFINNFLNTYLVWVKDCKDSVW